MNNKLIIILLIFFIIHISFSDTTQYLSFQFRIDNSAPKYSNLSINTSVVNNINDELKFSALWSDSFEGLDYYIFSYNISGNFENTTHKNFINNWSNITKKITNPDYEGNNVAFSFYGFDVNNNVNKTDYNYFNIVNKAPEFSNVTQSNDTPSQGDIVNLSSYWVDNFNVYDSVLETNKTGSWTSDETITHDSITTWSNYTFNTSGYSSGTVIGWRIKASDNVGNINTTNILTFTIN